MYKVSRQAKRYLTIWRNGNSVVNVLRFSVIYFRLMTLFPNDPIVTFLYWQGMTRQILVSRKKKEFCPMRGPPYSICNIVQSKSDNDIKIVWYHILKFQIFFICLLYLTCLCFLPCLKNRKRNWSYRQSRHDNMYALDNCDDVAQAKAAVAAPQ